MLRAVPEPQPQPSNTSVQRVGALQIVGLSLAMTTTRWRPMVVQTISILTLLIAPFISVVHDVEVRTVNKVSRPCNASQAPQPLFHCLSQTTRTCHVLTEQIGVRLNVVESAILLEDSARPLQYRSGAWMHPAVAQGTPQMPATSGLKLLERMQTCVVELDSNTRSLSSL